MGRICPVRGRRSDLVGRTRAEEPGSGPEKGLVGPGCTGSRIGARVGTGFARVSRSTQNPPTISHHFTDSLAPGSSPATEGGSIGGETVAPGTEEKGGGGGGNGRGRPPLGAAIGRRKNSSNAGGGGGGNGREDKAGGGGGGKGREDRATSSFCFKAAATWSANWLKAPASSARCLGRTLWAAAATAASAAAAIAAFDARSWAWAAACLAERNGGGALLCGAPNRASAAAASSTFLWGAGNPTPASCPWGKEP